MTEESLADYITRLEQENKELSFAIEKCLENAGIECDDEEQALRSLPMLGNAHYKVLTEKEALGQENKELKSTLEEIRNTLNRIFNVCDDDCGNANEITKVVDKINEVLNDK